MKYDDAVIPDNVNGLKTHIEDRENYTKFKWLPKTDPDQTWTLPFVTGHKYKISFGDSGLNYEKIKF